MTIPLFSENGKGENQIFLEFFCFFPPAGDSYSLSLFSPDHSGKITENPGNPAAVWVLPGCGEDKIWKCAPKYPQANAVELPGVSTMLGEFEQCRTRNHSTKHAGVLRGGRMISSPTPAGQVHDAVPCNGVRKALHPPGDGFAANFPKQTVAFLREIRYNDRNMKGEEAPVSFSIR